MSSLRDHFERVRAEKAARQANADPRLSARGRQLNRPLGNTMTRQTAPVQDAEYTDDDEIPSADGQRFLINLVLQDTRPTPLRLILNWAP